ncbi:MAG: transporter substrate-binding domain-containing protein [Bacilli bacterium]|jgi:polar amino acid transport system substrate-binding protein|nr:transporter substrate-binding domain-containing protein [Bacilli bacterium]HRT68853.1 transporter substrate-binding domain-containing protein [Bacilli bacterium]
MKKIICFVLLIISVFGLTGCKKNVLDKITKKGEIVIVTSPDYPAFEFTDESKSGQDKYVGSDIEFMKYIAKELGVTLKIEATDFDTTLALLSTGAADLAISGFTYKSERAENYELSNPYYQEGSQGIIVLKSDYDKNQYNTLAKLNVAGVKVGGQSGSLQFDYITNQLPNATAEAFTKIADGLLLLDNGTIKAVALASSVAENIITQQPNKYVFLEETFTVPTEETQLFVLAAKGQKELITKINEIIAKMIAEEKYEVWFQEATDLAASLTEKK